MGHGLGSDSDSDLSSAPPSPCALTPHRESSLSPAPTLSLGRASFPLTSPPQPQQQQQQETLSSATEPPWKSRPRPKRQLSTSAPNPPAASPKRRRQNRKASVTSKDVTGKGNGSSRKANEEKAQDESASGKGKQVAGARVKVGKIKLRVKEDSPATIDPETHAPNSGDEKLETLTSTLSKTVSPAPWKSKISPPSGLVDSSTAKPAPFSKTTTKPKLAPGNTVTSKSTASASSKSTSSKPAESSAPPNTSKPALIAAKPVRTAKRPVYTESNDSSQEEEEEIHKIHKRRKSHAAETATRKLKPKPKPSRKSRASTPPRSSPQPDSTSGPLELRPASFLTKSSSFLTKPIVPSTALNVQPREDVWSYDDLTGLTWIKLDIDKCQVVPGNEQPVTLGEQWCWWPAEVKQNTSNGLRLSLCGLGIERELTPNAAAESNILTFRKPNSSSVRFPTFKSAFSPPVVDVEVPSPDNEAFTRVSGGLLSTLPTTELSSILPTSSPAALETSWKRALTCAFEIDTESNDGLEDIFLLFSQRSKSPQDGDNDGQSGNTALEEQSSEQSEDEDVLENGMTVLCRYRTRYYPAKIISYHPREGKSKKRARLKGKYKCMFADESTRMAGRPEILTTLDEGFVTCPLGAYQRYTTTTYEKPTGIREPSPTPRADSPAPEPEDTQIDAKEYCSRERIRDQLKPVLPFLKGLIERRYIPGKGIVDSADLSEPEANDGSSSTELGTLVVGPSADADVGKELQPTLDRHAVFMQGGRARKNLAYSVYTGDLNEDDCEELMFELGRWALRGERWACGEVENHADGGDQEGKEGKECDATSQVIQKEQISQDGNTQEAGGSAVKNNAGLDGMGCDALQMQETDADMRGTDQEVNLGHDSQPQPEEKSSSSTELEDEPPTVVKILGAAPSTRGDFHSLVKLQPPRPSGASDYEALTAEERMGYVSDVLYPEAAALIISYRRGIRTQPGPLTDQAAEHALYTTGQEAAKNTTSTSDWVEQILAVRQLRESNSKYQVEEQTQVVLSGGTRSRPKYATSTLK